jgi:hypothetical protein
MINTVAENPMMIVGRELKMIELKREIEYLRTSGPTNADKRESRP